MNVIIPSVIATAAFTLFAVGNAPQAQKQRMTTGDQGLRSDDKIDREG